MVLGVNPARPTEENRGRSGQRRERRRAKLVVVEADLKRDEERGRRWGRGPASDRGGVASSRRRGEHSTEKGSPARVEAGGKG